MTKEDSLGMTMASRMNTRNSLLNSFKGLGRVTIEENGRKTALRIAFAGIYPDRLRFSVMDVSGRVVETFACDGHYMYLMSHIGDHPFMKKKTDLKTIEKVLSVPVLPEDFIGLVTGRPQLGNFDLAKTSSLPGDHKQLDLFKKNKTVTTLMVSPEETPQLMTKYDKKSRILYRVSFSGYTSHDGFSIPSVIFIRKGDHTSLKIEIASYWPNSNPEPEIFRLTDEGDAPDL